MDLKFVIAFIGRQGSSYLEGLLHSHPDAQCHGELLAYSGIGDRLFEHVESHVHTSGKSASGFKLALQHITAYPEIVEFMKIHGYKVIRLYRDNKLDQYISMRLAQINSSWRSDFGEYTVHTLSIDPDDLESEITLFRENDLILEKGLAGFPQIQLSYEELTKPNGHTVCLDFLGLSHCPLNSPFRRQRRLTRRETIQNYDSLVERFAGTEIARYFSPEG
ncbi:hypothetical protein HL658_02565 [Azospirillum sp. RWY-5-1]|uniref:Sulfotransferase n=1 Tax=Azospirillum oleiclasticum TaxID=2735135 RepID=A0ABX2T2Q0_9PROT|nr:hypothetical protein [Azospirillum oleiclasticum]NYZ11420.1 hypothetical protein [Azospirillum oleiclasticum]NYZ18581.1 hypothetical protein [Azospirillum oleiclasticum]